MKTTLSRPRVGVTVGDADIVNHAGTRLVAEVAEETGLTGGLSAAIDGDTTGVRSSRGIEKRCHDDVAFRFLAANQAPDFRSVARFRRRHLAALEALFVQVLGLCRRRGWPGWVGWRSMGPRCGPTRVATRQ